MPTACAHAPSRILGSESSGATRPAAAPQPRLGAADTAGILTAFDRAELAGAACTLGDLVRELGRADEPRSVPEIVALLDAYHRHLCGAHRACPADGEIPVLAFGSFARSARRRMRAAEV